MLLKTTQYGFTAGSVGPVLWSQTNLQKYGFGASLINNYIVRYTGGVVSRGGLMRGACFPAYGGQFKFVPFIFARQAANVFGLLFVPYKVYIIQDGKFVLEAVKNGTVASSTSTRTTITAASHGFVVGDLVQLSGAPVPSHIANETVEVVTINSANSFDVRQINLDKSLDGWTTSSAFSVQRVVTVTTPYAGADLDKLNVEQTRDVCRLTHPSYAVRTLYRVGTTWGILAETFVSGLSPPSGGAVQFASSVGTAFTLFAVTAVSADGEESSTSDIIVCRDIVDYTSTSGYVTISWNPVPGAVRYYVYRSLVTPAGAVAFRGLELGYIGSTSGTVFTDRNIIPDFGRTPRRNNRVFTPSIIQSVTVTAGGTGYDGLDTGLLISDATGAGGLLNALVSNTVITAVDVIDSGQFYTNPTITIVSGGTGASLSAVLSPSTGIYPRTSVIHQQRQFYASTANQPLNLWASTQGAFSSFSTSSLLTATEAFTLDLASKLYGTVLHMLSTKLGLLLFTDFGLWLVRGSQGSSFSLRDHQADIQTSIGSSAVPPLSLESDVLYIEAGSQIVRILSYNDIVKSFTGGPGSDLTVFVRHLFTSDNYFVDWCLLTQAHRQVWAVTSSGGLYSLTLSMEEKVQAWAEHPTDGFVHSVITLPYETEEHLFAAVVRTQQGRSIGCIEKMYGRNETNNWHHCGVDGAVKIGFNAPNAVLTIPAHTAAGELITVSASSGVFVSQDTGSVLHTKTFRGVVSEYLTNQTVKVIVTKSKLKGTVTFSSGHWFLDVAKTETTLPLNARYPKLVVGADGKVQEELTPAEDWKVKFTSPVFAGYAGLSYTCRLDTLPLVIPDARTETDRIRPVEILLHLHESRGLFAGAVDETGTPAYEELPEISEEYESDGIKLQTGVVNIPVGADSGERAFVTFQSNGAHPAEITGITVVQEVGDALR